MLSLFKWSALNVLNAATGDNWPHNLKYVCSSYLMGLLARNCAWECTLNTRLQAKPNQILIPKSEDACPWQSSSAVFSELGTWSSLVVLMGNSRLSPPSLPLWIVVMESSKSFSATVCAIFLLLRAGCRLNELCLVVTELNGTWVKANLTHWFQWDWSTKLLRSNPMLFSRCRLKDKAGPLKWV